jgi:ATP-dependent RNA helicase DeaD
VLLYNLKVKNKMESTFEDLGISAPIIKALNEHGYKNPFPIQKESIPIFLKGLDMIGQAHTGTGKTAAYALPILTKIQSRVPIQALILVPTRELAVQVTNEINKFAKYTGIRTISIYGGQSIAVQQEQLRRGVQIVVATPGRLIDHLKRGSIQLDNVKYVILDEADRMLDMGFIEDIKFILFYVNEDRQTCLFSATMPSEIINLAQEYMNNYSEIRLNKDELSLDTIDQAYLIVKENEKFKHLCTLIRNRNQKQQTIIFVSTKQRTQKVFQYLKGEGFKATMIHGDLSQKQRNYAIYRFRNESENILVATDIVARGIDVPTVGHVINYDVPEDPDTYFHRIGRTARAGGTGIAISLVSNERIDTFTRIMRRTKQNMRKLNDEMGIEIPVIQRVSYHSHYRDKPYTNYYNGSNNRSGNNYGYGYGNNYRGSGYRRSTYGNYRSNNERRDQ